MRNILAAVPSASKEMVAATVRTVFTQRTPDATRAQLCEVVGILEPRFAKAADVLEAAEADVTAYAAFPRAHWRKIASTNPLERINKKIQASQQRRGHLPRRRIRDPPRRSVLVEQHDDWVVTDRRYLSEGSMALIDQPQEVTTTNEITAA